MSYKFLLAFLLVTGTFGMVQAAFEVNSILRRLDKMTLTAAASALRPFRRLDEIAVEEVRAAARASGVGAYFSRAIKQVRGGTDEFYGDVITAAKIALCEHGLGKNSIRFVNSAADNAYKNSDGDCVRLLGSPPVDEEVVRAYDQGQCEIMPNCYWAPIEDGDTRRARVYADPDSTMNKENAATTLKNWLVGVIGFVAPGVILGVLSLFTMLFFLFCRCCCNRCGGRHPRKEGYTRAQKYVPVLLFLIFSMGVFVISTAALLYRNSILGSVDEIFSATSGLLENGSDWVVSIRDPLENIRDKVNSSVDLVIRELNGSDFIEAGVYGLIGRLRAFGEYSANRTLPDGCSVDTDQSKAKYVGTNGNICLPCDVCTTISTEIDAASDEIEAKADPGVQQLITVRSQLDDKLVNVADSVREAVNSKVLVADDLIATLGVTHSKINHYDGIFQSYRDALGVEIMKLFYFAGGVIMVGTAGILFGLLRMKLLANLIHVAYFVGFIVLVIIFILSAVVLALGIVLGDSCEVTLLFTANWTVPLGDSARAVDACFQNESLLDVFNLSSQLSFARGGIHFPTLDVNSMLDFSALDDFSATIAATKETTFEFSEAYFEEVVAFVNTYALQNAKYCKLNDKYTTENVLQPWLDNEEEETSSDTPVAYITKRYESFNDDCPGVPDLDYGQPFVCTSHSNPCDFSEFMGEQFSVLVNIASIKSSVVDFVDLLQRNVTDVVEFTHEFKTNVTNLLGRIENIKDNLESSLIKYVSDFEKATYCTFIADGFFSIYDAICVHMAPSISMIGLMLLAVGILLVPVNISLIIGVKRLNARRFGPVLPGGTKPTDVKLAKFSKN
ncbi:hypothetical protein PHYPSEUDO_000721 [Phytophthora pseudosyringae]|uniref:Uncharacterized protein n=1 Tax=Phytophthora pseudosyringae TaxID=221518 RepID=A0A8T1W1P7_9STRA|nr:hypothetical protein PHYPSEUDO_000721 [Phytophthora pseudosyringae]